MKHFKLKILYKDFFIKSFVFISFFLFCKIIISHFTLDDENLYAKILFEFTDIQYFPLIKSISNFEFSPSYNPIFFSKDIISFSFGSLILHVIFFKVFGVYSFYILEFILIFIFLLIFYLISFKLIFKHNYSIFFSFFLFILCNSAQYLDGFLPDDFLIKFSLLNTFQTIYSLRIPRPIVTNLLFYICLFSLMKFYKNINHGKINIYYPILIYGIILNTFFYHFIIISLVFLFVVLLLYFKNKKLIFNFFNNKYLYLNLIIFSLFLCLFIFQIKNGSSDYSERIGLFKIGIDQKILLLKYLIEKSFKIEFLSLITFNFFLFIYIKKRILINIEYYKILNIFFLSSVISPYIFIVFSPNVIQLYHFNNYTLAIGFILTFINLLFIFNFLFKKNKKISLVTLVLSILFIFCFSLNLHQKILVQKNERILFTKVAKYIYKHQLPKNTLLLSDNLKLNIWWVLNDFKYLNMPDVFTVSLSNQQIEDNIINSFKFLRYSEDEFINFFNQNILTWRIYNPNSFHFLSSYKYQANSLYTYSSQDDYNPNFIDFIKKSSPLYNMTTIIPNSELKRMKSKYINYNFNNKLIPDVVFFNKNSLTKKSVLFQKNFCEISIDKNYIFLIKKTYIKDCVILD
jgi:hypothetical protein